MDMVRIFHMAQGLGETSYAQNSRLHKEVIESVMDITLSSAMEACADVETVSIADLGCSSGRNTLSVVESIIRAVCERRREATQQLPEFMVFLNDLSSNDFNALFSLVPEFVHNLKAEHDDSGGILVSVAGAPGSFYGRLFPSSSLHFIASFTSLHWLSQVPAGLLNKGEPINKGNVYMSPASPPSVATRYFEQFQEDFSMFLRSRSQELVVGGRMVLSMLGRRSHDIHKKINEFPLYEALSKSLSIFVSQELEDQVYREGSFTINSMKQYYKDWMFENAPNMLSKTFRAANESLICHHFGEEIIEPLFETHTQVLYERLMAGEDIGLCQITVVLCKSATR
ncbi:salicylate carboxymethyltransferase-like [Iris pallida]|uniref:Salicylate carboxymethyltransferase-like n=1 Tax=Iris pallida TaxID=29817 RepID=A0AAX6FPR0_IRIPA|nr:salicylate carboxymethyltransferase-like [Iris pallida]KAJ6818352.1 salicylate carboxymethyltransferase-like [Iris pallida]